jgi:8-oxo-dGTP diphosphatase
MSQQRAVTHVAVGVVFSPDRRQVLFGQRPKGKPYAGWWELPGGKLEPGETVRQALVRELEEELGICATQVLPWGQLEHEYPHAYVRLHFCRVLAFTGEPASLEQQAFQWAKRDVSDISPLLPATGPVLRWLALPEELLWTGANVQPGLNVLSAQELRALKAGQVETRLQGAFIDTLADLALAASRSLDFTVLRLPTQVAGEKLPHQMIADFVERAHQPLYVHLDAVSEDAKAVLLELGAQGISCRHSG